MKSIVPTATALAVMLLIGMAASPSEGGKAPPGLEFLEVGKDYVVRFPDASNIFRTSKGGVSESKYTTADGQTHSTPVTWNFTLSVNVFHVVRFSGGSWVLLRHPTDPDDFLRWSEQRRAKAILAGPHVDAIGAKPDGPERLKKLRDAAGADIPTSETWVNLDHAIAIAAAPTLDEYVKVSIHSIMMDRKD